MKEKLLGWIIEEFAVAAEIYRVETGKCPLSNLSGALEVQKHWFINHGPEVKLPELHPYHDVPVDLGWARALFSKVSITKAEGEHHEKLEDSYIGIS